MRKMIACILASCLLLTCAGCSFGRENQGSESGGSVQSASAVQAEPALAASAAEVQDSAAIPEKTQGSALEASGAMVEITIPAQYGEAAATQQACDAIAEEEHYDSVTLNEDGSVTYVMTAVRHQQLMKDTASSIDASLESLCGSADYPNLVSVTPNEDYTEFTVFTKSTALGTEETRSEMNFYLYGGMYQAMAGNPDAAIHVIFRNSDTDEILGESDSSVMQASTTAGFTDVPADSYYADAVLWAVENGIAAGTDDTHFSPDEPCTRAQLVMFLWRAAGEPEPAAAELPYTDIDENTAGYDAIRWAAAQGIVSADAGTAFSPDETVTRGETVLMLWRYAGSPAAQSTESTFDDVESGSELCSAVMWAVEQGITAGTEEKAFAPEEECTRAQIMTFLYRDLGAQS